MFNRVRSYIIIITDDCFMLARDLGLAFRVPFCMMLLTIIKKTALFPGAVINVLGSLAAVFIFVFPGVHDVLVLLCTLIRCLFNAGTVNKILRQDPNHSQKQDPWQDFSALEASSPPHMAFNF